MEGLIDCVVVLRPTRHKIIHFGDVSPTVWKKLNLAQQKHAFINRKKCTVPVLEHKNKHKNPKPGFVAFYDIPPGNAADLFSKEKRSKGGDK